MTSYRRAAWMGLALVSLPSQAWSRVVDYTLTPEAMIEAGQSLKIVPVSVKLSPFSRLETVVANANVDHVNQALSKYCSTYKVENPISRLFDAHKREWNAAGGTSTERITPINLIITSASSYRRCVEVKEMNVRCITKVRMNGSVTLANARPDMQPISVSGEAERDASVGGFCESLAKGIGVISREAGLALLMDADQKLVSAELSSAVNPTPSSPPR